MKNLNHYITEAWSGVKTQSLKADMEVWCKEMGIKNYTINPKGEIDVDGFVELDNKNFKELPYKFGRVDGYFNIGECNNLTSLKNCPDEVGKHFSCVLCPQLDSLKGCPKKVGLQFYCYNCKRKFTVDEVKSLCKVKGNVFV